MARNKFDIDESLESPFNIQHLKRSFIYVKKYKGKMILALCLSLFSVIAGLFGPLIIQEAIDVAIAGGDAPYLILLVALLALSIGVSILFNVLRSRITARVGQNIIYDIRQDLFEHLQQLPFSYYDNRPHGKILVRVVQYVNNVSDMLSNGIINFFLEIFNLIFVTVFMLIADARLTLVILAGLPVLVLIVLLIMPVQRRAWQNFSNKNSNMNAYLHESILGAGVTQIFTREKVNAGIAGTQFQNCRKSFLHAVFVSNWIWFSVEIIAAIVGAAVYGAGILFIKPMATFGTIVAMGDYSWRFWRPITNLANLYNNLINTVAYLERIFETIDEPVEIEDAPDAKALPPIRGEVEFKDVVFEYDPGHPILDHMSFKVKAGESIALVGPTGAGKTTVINLISRFYDISSGQVLIDGHDVSKATLHSLRSQMGVMLQDSFVFSGNVIDNIRYGKLDATYEEVVAAAKTVKAHEFIETMEKGYHTEVNERGSRLSQGQKQLISFARTLIADPKILILDEATSSIDTRTERLMQEGLNELMKGRTSFIIAHRLSTIQHCDRILYIDGGVIQESGTHDELLRRKGKYYELYMSQREEAAI
ncbi:MAG: ABC transporter ATP-binding protein [Oscillospiraceae bacterium]|nr:ABC transporter ATP-binding protein [Oscillospiraceae bacterium]